MVDPYISMIYRNQSVDNVFPQWSHGPCCGGECATLAGLTPDRDASGRGLRAGMVAVSIQRREVRLTKTKTSSPRVVPLSDAASAPRHTTSAYVFWHRDGISRQPVPTGHRRHSSPSGDPRPPHDPDDHAVRPHGHQPPPPGDGRFRHKNRHNRDGIARQHGFRHSCKCLIHKASGPERVESEPTVPLRVQRFSRSIAVRQAASWVEIFPLYQILATNVPFTEPFGLAGDVGTATSRVMIALPRSLPDALLIDGDRSSGPLPARSGPVGRRCQHVHHAVGSTANGC
jgi:hypothetical protein